MIRLLILLFLPATAAAQVMGTPQSDLSVRILLDDVTLDADTRFDLPWRVHHEGTEPSQPTSLLATWSTDARPSDDDVPLCRAPIGSLAMDDTLDGRIADCRVPAHADGDAWIFLRIDTDDVLWDPDPTNDRDVQRVVVGDHEAAWLTDTALPSDAEGAGADDPVSEPIAGCGCTTGGRSAGSLAVLAGLVLGARRRRS